MTMERGVPYKFHWTIYVLIL